MTGQPGEIPAGKNRWYQYVLANPGWTTGDGFMINHLTSVKTVTEGFLRQQSSLR
ncbi:hypothetical protein H6S10_09275 [Escherichia coli]|nr:hypothetical protein H6S10_09275 [Escherichia coli]